MFRILYVSHDAGLSGAPSCLLDIFEKLNRNEFRPVFACPGEGPLVKKAEDLDIECFKFGMSGFRSLCSIIEKNKISLVHANTLLTPYAVRAGKSKKVPVAWHIHEYPDFCFDTMMNWFFFSRFPDIVITASATLREKLIAKREKIVTVCNGVNLEKFAPGFNKKTRNEFGIGDSPLAVHVGSIEPRKGIQYFIKSIPCVLKDFPSCRFLIVGDSPPHMRNYIDKMRKLAGEIGVAEKITFAGLRADIRRILNNADLLVLASLKEVLPKAILEAMACALPVVATRVGGIPELVREDTGILVEPADPVSLAAGIKKVLSDKDTARNMGEKARKRVEEHFSLDRYIQGIERIYRGILQ